MTREHKRELKRRREIASLISTPMKIICPFCGGRTANCVDAARHLIKKHDKQLCVCDELNIIRSPLESKVWALAKHLHATGDAEAHLNYYLMASVDYWVIHAKATLKAGNEWRVQLPVAVTRVDYHVYLRNNGPSDVIATVSVRVVNGKPTGEWRSEQTPV